MVIRILPTAISLLDCRVDGRPSAARRRHPLARGGWTARRSPLGLPPAGLTLLVGAVGVIWGGQLGPAGVIAQQVAQVRARLMDQTLLLQVELPGLGGVHA